MALVYEPKIMRITDGESGYATLPCSEAVYKHNLEGVDELSVTTTDMLGYTDRVLFCDRMGRFHEMMYDSGRHGHESGATPSGSVKLYSSVNELWDAYVLDKRPEGSADAALASILAGTRWQVGSTFDVDGSHGFVFYHKSARECLKEICEAFNCFFRPTITVEGGRITERKIDLFRSLGETPKRFTWTKDLTSVYRELGDEKPKTRVYGWGKGVETEAGGYGRRLSFADINGGKAYVEDAAATEALGYVGADGHRMPLEGDYVNEQCEDPEQLLAETRAYLAGVSQPSVRYTADVISLADFGREWENVEVGQTAAIIDKGFSDEGLRLRGQVAELSEDLIHKRTVVGFGTITDILSARQAVVSQSLSSLRDQSAGWQVTTDAGVSWLNTVMGNLNAAFDQSGTYKFSSFTQGDIWSSVPLDENGRATKPGGWAINLNGAGMRLASSLNPDGSWNWRSFGTGKGFSADFMTTGTLDASRVTIKNLMRIGRENGWHLALGGDHISMTDEDGKTAMEILGSRQAWASWQKTNFEFGKQYEVPNPAGYNNGMRKIEVTLGYINRYYGTANASYEVLGRYENEDYIIEHHGHGSDNGMTPPASQTMVQLHFKFNQPGDKMIVWATAYSLAADGDVTSKCEPLPFVSLLFPSKKSTVDIKVAEGEDQVLTKQNFDEMMSNNGTAPYTGSFSVTYAYNNLLRYFDLTFVNGLLISAGMR